MKPPKCTPYLPAARYARKVVRSLRYDDDALHIDIEILSVSPAFARVVFREPEGFRVLDERDLCEFWNTYSEPNGWLYEVEEGGWMELESSRKLFNAPSVYPSLREFMIMDYKCISVLTVHPPEIVDLGAEPEQSGI